MSASILGTNKISALGMFKRSSSHMEVLTVIASQYERKNSSLQILFSNKQKIRFHLRLAEDI